MLTLKQNQLLFQIQQGNDSYLRFTLTVLRCVESGYFVSVNFGFHLVFKSSTQPMHRPPCRMKFVF